MPGKKGWMYAHPKGFSEPSKQKIHGSKARGDGMHRGKAKGRAGQRSGMRKRTGGKSSGY